MRNIDFSSWQTLLISLFGLALASKSTAAVLAPFLVVHALLGKRLDRREAARLVGVEALGARQRPGEELTR